MVQTDNKCWVIYKLISPSGRTYIGKTINKNKRLGDYRRLQCKNQKILYRSLKKYGYDNHVIEIIDQFESNQEYASGKEIFWIRTYMSNVARWGDKYKGLNCTDGGEGMLGAKHSEETKRKLSEHFKSNPSKQNYIPLTVEQQSKRLATFKRTWDLRGRKGKPQPKGGPRGPAKGTAPPNKGKPMPEHQKAILRLANTGRVAWNKGKDYSYLSKEERKEKFGKHNIGSKHDLSYLRTSESISKNTIKRSKPLIFKRLPNGEQKEYPSIQELIRKEKVGSAAVWFQLTGQTKTPKKYFVKFKEEVKFKKFDFKRKPFKLIDIKLKIA